MLSRERMRSKGKVIEFVCLLRLSVKKKNWDGVN